MEIKKIYYICDGPVRGWCGHKHKKISAAEQCLKEDRIGCRNRGGYSDRAVYSITEYEDGTRKVSRPLFY